MRIAPFFAASLKARRWQACITQQELADASNLDKAYISLLENAQRPASFEAVIQISKGLGVNPSDLIADVINRIRSCPAQDDLDPVLKRIIHRN